MYSGTLIDDLIGCGRKRRKHDLATEGRYERRSLQEYRRSCWHRRLNMVNTRKPFCWE